MANIIADLTHEQALLMLEELKEVDLTITKKLNYVINTTSCSLQEALEYIVSNSPTLWAKVYLNWNARDYQYTILDQGKKRKKLS